MARLVVVDDTSDLIRYSGTWNASDGSQYDNAGNFGKPYMNSLRKATGETSFTFKFNGTSGQAFGTIDMDFDNKDPSWECFVDGLEVQSNPVNYVENNWRLCEWTSTSNAEHNLTVNIHSKNRPFILDHINYVADPANPPRDDFTVVLYQHTDSQINYTPNKWETFAKMAHINTQTSGPNDTLATINFYGSRLSWYSMVPREMAQNTLTAAWSVDGNAPVNFTVVGKPDKKDRNTRYNELYFETPRLSLASHTLTVHSYGSPSTVPFMLAYLIIDEGQVLAATSSSSVPPSTTTFSGSSSVIPTPGTSISSTPAQNKIPASTYHVIIGVLVGLFACFVIGAAILYIRRRRRRQHISEISSDPFGDGSILPSTRGGYSPLNNASTDFVSMPNEHNSYSESLENRITPFRLSESTLVTPQPFTDRTQRHLSANHRPSGSTSTSANSLFPTSRLTPLPEKVDSSISTNASRGSRQRPYENSLFPTGLHSRASSSTTLLQSESNIPLSKLPPPISLSIADNQNTRPTIVIRHDDSGIRMPHPLNQNESMLVDRPPIYTPG